MSTTELTYRDAITRALHDALAEDGDVILLGEDVAAAGGAFKVTAGLFETFGPSRVMDTPISEQAIIGAAIGAAVQGLKPVAEIMFADFAGTCFDGIANEVPKYRYMTGGQVTMPLVVRMANGAGGGFGAQHSQSVENWFLNVAGLKIAVPSTPADAYGLLRAAIADPDPVLYFEHKNLFNLKQRVDRLEPVELGRADVVREGEDITIVASQMMRHRALEAAERLAGEGVSAAVIDPRCVAPLDLETIVGSLEVTNRLLVVQESTRAGSWGSSLIADVVREQFELLDAPPALLGGDETPIPYAEELESAWLPSAERIAALAKTTVAY
jgi:pyruvate/2-oxoglutarate/acetoin dehydrogenase E1 component